MVLNPRNLFLIVVALALAGCASQRTAHTSGPLQLELGPGAGSAKIAIRSFRDERPAEQRLRRLFPNGEAYGDADFAVSPSDALLQELSAAVALQAEPDRLRTRFAEADIVLKKAEFSLHIEAAGNANQNPSVPPGVAGMESLMFAAFGGKTYVFCEIVVEINGNTHLGTRRAVVAGDPPPEKGTYVSHFTKAVGQVLKQSLLIE